jgi:hypothetical protein
VSREGLIGGTWGLRGLEDQLLRELPELQVSGFFTGVATNTKQPREHPYHIAIQNGFGLVESDAAYRSGGVPSDARQAQDFLKLFRKPPAVLFQDDARGLLHIPNARVIPKPFPELVNFLLLRSSEGGDVRQGAHPRLPISNDGFDPRLLEHDFRNPNRVRVTRSPPGQIARILREPTQQRFDERAVVLLATTYFQIETKV